MSYPSPIKAHQPSMQNSNQGPKLEKEKCRLDPILMTYTEFFPQLIANHLVKPIVLKPLTPPFLKWYNPNAQCEYHARIPGHSTEDCTLFKYKVQGLVWSGALNFDEPSIIDAFLLDRAEN